MIERAPGAALQPQLDLGAAARRCMVMGSNSHTKLFITLTFHVSRSIELQDALITPWLLWLS